MVCNTQNHWFSEFCPLSDILNNKKTQRFGNWVCFLLQVSSFSWGPNRVGESLPSLESRNRSSCRKAVFNSYLEYRTIDKVHKTSDPEALLDLSGSV
jgi:hypothetical protein